MRLTVCSALSSLYTVATVCPAATRCPSCTCREMVPLWAGSASSVRTSQPSMEMVSSAWLSYAMVKFSGSEK